MKRTELVCRLRKLQADAYGAPPSAERTAERCIAKYGKIEDEAFSRTCYEHGALMSLSRELARGIDLLIADLGPGAK